MNTSAFDPQSFLDAQITETMVKRPPLPVGDYRAVIGDISARQWTGKADPSKTGIAWDIPLTVEVPAAIQHDLGLMNSTLNLKDSVMIDLTENGTINTAPGANRRLRAYRDATDNNVAGQPFSARMLVGKVITVKIAHDIWEDAPIEKITGVAKS